LTTIILKKGKEEPVRRRHPWVFSGAIARIEGKPDDGDIVAVHDAWNNLLGVGHYHDGSIAVRLISFEAVDPNALDFWTDKLENAQKVREWCHLPQKNTTDAFRLVHGEGDGLSGLIIDIYGATAVVQCHSIGMHRQRALIAQAIKAVFQEQIQCVYDKSVESLPPKYAAEHQNGTLLGNPDAATAVVVENQIQFKVDWVTGQKTGFFLDQRDNRQLLASFVKDKTVLNTFCYTGGFSCYAVKAGAKLVHSVDVSAKAMELTVENIALNAPFSGTHEAITADVMHYLREIDQFFDVVIVDPPAFAKSMEKRHNAVQGYKRLNAMALEKVAPNGIMFTFSCSQVIDRELFYNTIAAAAIEAKREIRVLRHLTQGSDHPVSMFHPEGAYLKGLVLHVV
jgi:23S rRNA (cytosine1962-C5)-methyltransferase